MDSITKWQIVANTKEMREAVNAIAQGFEKCSRLDKHDNDIEMNSHNNKLVSLVNARDNIRINLSI